MGAAVRLTVPWQQSGALAWKETERCCKHRGLAFWPDRERQEYSVEGCEAGHRPRAMYTTGECKGLLQVCYNPQHER